MNSPSTACVFLVDDDEDDRFLVQQIFRRQNTQCQLRPIDNGEELLKALLETDVLPTLILLDLNMPFMGGFEALRHIRQQPAYDAVPIIIFTTSDQPSDHRKAMELKANGFITKSPSIEKLNQVVLQLRRTWLEDKCEICGKCSVPA